MEVRFNMKEQFPYVPYQPAYYYVVWVLSRSSGSYYICFLISAIFNISQYKKKESRTYSRITILTLLNTSFHQLMYYLILINLAYNKEKF